MALPSTATRLLYRFAQCAASARRTTVFCAKTRSREVLPPASCRQTLPVPELQWREFRHRAPGVQINRFRLFPGVGDSLPGELAVPDETGLHSAGTRRLDKFLLVRSNWSGRWGSNPRHSAWEADVLPLNYARPSAPCQCLRKRATRERPRTTVAHSLANPASYRKLCGSTSSATRTSRGVVTDSRHAARWRCTSCERRATARNRHLQ